MVIDSKQPETDSGSDAAAAINSSDCRVLMSLSSDLGIEQLAGYYKWQYEVRGQHHHRLFDKCPGRAGRPGSPGVAGRVSETPRLCQPCT